MPPIFQVRRAQQSCFPPLITLTDPAIIHTDRWYAFATRTIGSSIHVQVATSWDFNSWSLEYNSDGSQYNALPNLPAWAIAHAPNTWAPDVNQLDDGTFIMYYSASTKADSSKHCVGAATSRTVRGPYIPTSSEPLFCPLSEGGAIDASGYNDDGQRYIVYKIDGNSLGHGGPCGNTVEPLVATPIILQPVASDGHTLTGSPTKLLDHQGISDDGILEAPVVVKKNGIYFLLFSSGCFTSTNYNVDYATAPSIFGPYTRAARPLLSTGDHGLSGPGGADVSKDLKFMVFHANSAGGRALYTAMLTVSGKTLSVA
ncbi:glycoside hydrolase family 43 protein [Pseudocercospora fijiensis CIRAD86]|uniref:Glycoside hydrolase family 43 protein n=1 Tax=Pseudocercospora fijiensis (strain CIRAD86) TaxID=383855 RepID=M2YVV5_PSEFD|nr:glycoside hydrolase family 43 protein [Pseudocercospora fijiensis CIRAD86]EME81830.1 glycoside hydrolase family 43 protein [Pseudocercospora fijiensis CIRAD86]